MIDENQLKEFIINVVKDDDISVDNINDDTVLIGEDGIFFDSVDVLELIVELDNKFGIKVQDDDIVEEKLKTFKTFSDFIKDKQK